MASRVGSYPAAPAPRVAQAVTKATGPTMPPAATRRPVPPSAARLPRDQAGQGPDGGHEADGDHDRAAANGGPGQLVLPGLPGRAHEGQTVPEDQRRPQGQDEEGEQV